MEKSYEEITVFELQELYETDITATIRLDGDRKAVYINTLNISLENFSNALVQAFEPLVSAVAKAIQKLFEALRPQRKEK